MVFRGNRWESVVAIRVLRGNCQLSFISNVECGESVTLGEVNVA